MQAALDINDQDRAAAACYTGVLLDLLGNGQNYNIHLRTLATQRPWQSYGALFQVCASWQTILIPYSLFLPHRLDVPFDAADIQRLGLVAIGRAFQADLCLGRVAFYRQ